MGDDVDMGAELVLGAEGDAAEGVIDLTEGEAAGGPIPAAPPSKRARILKPWENANTTIIITSYTL